MSHYLQLPLEVLPHVRRMSAVQLSIWADAWTWAKQGAKAYRTNEQLAEMFGCTVKSVSKAIAGLRSAGLIESSMVNGRQRILTATIPSNVHPPERPSSSTSILPKVKAASPPTSTLHPPEVPPCIPSNVHQVDNRIEQIVEHEVEQGVVLPWESDDFKRMWSEWKQERKERKTKKYTLRGEQAALHKLQTDSNGDEQTAIAIIQQSIANSWTGLFPLKASKGGRNHNNGQPSITAEEFARVVTKKYW